MLDTRLSTFLDKIVNGLRNRGLDEASINKRIPKLKDKYIKSGIFTIDIPDDDDDIENDVIKPLTAYDRVKAWQTYYRELQDELGEDFFSDEEITPEINVRGLYGRTLLHKAVLANDIIQVDSLLKTGADPHVKDNNNHNPHNYGIFLGDREAIVELLRKAMTQG
jgi:ankyrin repeat protein